MRAEPNPDPCDLDDSPEVELFIDLIVATYHKDRAAAARATRELRRLGWSCVLIAPRPKRGEARRA
jgi:hypothetical protein